MVVYTDYSKYKIRMWVFIVTVRWHKYLIQSEIYLHLSMFYGPLLYMLSNNVHVFIVNAFHSIEIDTESPSSIIHNSWNLRAKAKNHAFVCNVQCWQLNKNIRLYINNVSYSWTLLAFFGVRGNREKLGWWASSCAKIQLLWTHKVIQRKVCLE